MKIVFTKYLVIVCACILIACSEQNETTQAVKTEDELIFTTNDENWTYISLEKGCIIGSSELLDTEADKIWAERSDWDIAICGDLLKTNSGTSGQHEGGALVIENVNYYALDQAPTSGYITDKDNITVKR